MNPIMFEGMMANGFAPGGQLTTTTDVENYPGFPEGVMGGELMDKMRAQSERCGTVIETETITKLETGKLFKLWREGAEESDEPTDTADAVVIATGASARRMNLPGEDKYWQNGISACAVCDGAVPIFRNKPLVVIGGGDSAAEEAIYLTKCKNICYHGWKYEIYFSQPEWIENSREGGVCNKLGKIEKERKRKKKAERHRFVGSLCVNVYLDMTWCGACIIEIFFHELQIRFLIDHICLYIF